ncbi:MAG TPA: prolyl oligopeptidase family serine peptidase [Chitinophagaceae bacterium]|nr:prolyl oligopeptidase family serine peptidase [Chitinophagaceae bacterium]
MKKNFCFLILSFIVNTTTAQQLSKSDYNRAVSYIWQNLNNKKVFNVNVDANWFADSTGFSFITQNKQGKYFNKLELKKMQIEPLFDHQRLAKILTDSLKISVKSTDLPVNAILHIDKSKISFIAGGKTYFLDLNTYNISQKVENPPVLLEEKSPDGRWIAYTDQYNLYIKSTENGTIKQLSTGGKKNYEFATYYGWADIIEGENGERPPRFRVNWSPDSKWIQTFICDLRFGNKMYLLDWGVDTLYRARLLSYYRASPGDTAMVRMIPVFFNIETGEEYIKSELRSTHTNPISYEWSKESGIIYEENHHRGYQQIDLHRIDLNSRSSDLLYRETSQTNIDTYNSWIVEEWGKIIIASEKDGWRQLYSLDIKNKSFTPVTNGTYYVNNISFFDKKSKTIIFTASGKEAGRNPYYQHAYKTGIDGKRFVILTPENANHDISVSPDGKYFTDNISALDQPAKTVLRDISSGKILKELSNAIIEDLLAMNYRFPETFTSTGRDGSTTIYGAIWKPSNFDPAKKYPVIDQSYTGPHTNMFPRSFQAALARNNQPLAELGFIVVTIDGMGTAGRSKAFHNVSYKNMGKNLTDHILTIKELAKKYSWIDADRVGIFGHSAGGFDAGHAVLEFPDFYKVAVASSADHDFRMEKDWWPEMYMGWPVDSTYHYVSNITMAGNLKGKLLITHGGIDENVNPSATFKLAEALVKADKEFDMLILPSQRHGYTGKFNDYFTKKKWNYFVEHLLGVKPIWEFELR